MKYIKTYESKILWEPTYSIGDYVEVYLYDPPYIVDHEPVLITSIDYYEHCYKCQYILTPKYGDCFADDYIIRKLEPHEVDAIKYNL
jgi:hypothetical protein